MLWQVALIGTTCVLALWAGWLIFSAVSRTGLSLGITSSTQAVIFGSYVCLSITHMFVQERAGATGYSVISATIWVYFGKCAASLVILACRGNLKMDSFDAGGAKFGKTFSVFLLMGTGSLFAFYDCISFLVLRNFDPATYQVLTHMRVIFVGVLWQIVFRSQLSGKQWQSLLLLVAAGITKLVARAGVLDPSVLGATIALVVVQCTLSAFANVYAEALLKDMAKMPTDLVNAIMYFWGTVSLTMVMMIAEGPGKISSELISSAAWTKLQGDPWMMGSIVSLVVFGITAAYLLKHLSNIVKEMSGAFVIIISAILEVAIIGMKVMTMLDLCGIVLAVLSIGIYCTNPVGNQPPASEKASEERERCAELKAEPVTDEGSNEAKPYGITIER